jgi:hypothetical protein
VAAKIETKVGTREDEMVSDKKGKKKYSMLIVNNIMIFGMMDYRLQL